MESSVWGATMILLKNVSYWWEDGEIALDNINLEFNLMQIFTCMCYNCVVKKTFGQRMRNMGLIAKKSLNCTNQGS